MRCPSCGTEVADSGAAACPTCGRALYAPDISVDGPSGPGGATDAAVLPAPTSIEPGAAETTAGEGAAEVPAGSADTPAPSSATADTPAPSSATADAPVPAPPTSGPTPAPAMSGQQAPNPPNPAYPIYAPYGYGQMAPPSVPLAPGQAAPSVPLMMGGQPVPPTYPPGYGPPSQSFAPPSQGYAPPSQGYAPPSQGFAPYPPGYGPYPQPMPAQPRKGRVWLVVGIVAAVLVVCVLLAGGLAAVLAVTPSGSVSTSSGITPVTATTASTPSATPSENVIFQDDFSSSSSGWGNDSHCAYGTGGYHIPDGYFCYAPTGNAGDMAISADVKQVAGETQWFYGVGLRRASPGNFYAFMIASNGDWVFEKFVGNKGSHLLPYVPSAAIHTGLNAINTLKVRAVGSHFEFFINGTKVGQFDDSTYTSGKCGLIGNNQGQVEIVATHFSLAVVG